jgi:hypothetical protein
MHWPQSLRTTLSILLNAIPMFLSLGDDLIQFYNIAYRPSLGNDGKHLHALGQKGKDCIIQMLHQSSKLKSNPIKLKCCPISMLYTSDNFVFIIIYKGSKSISETQSSASNYQLVRVNYHLYY